MWGEESPRLNGALRGLQQKRTAGSEEWDLWGAGPLCPATRTPLLHTLPSWETPTPISEGMWRCREGQWTSRLHKKWRESSPMDGTCARRSRKARWSGTSIKTDSSAVGGQRDPDGITWASDTRLSPTPYCHMTVIPPYTQTPTWRETRQGGGENERLRVKKDSPKRSFKLKEAVRH